MSVRIVTDSTCDLPPETIARYNIRVVPLYINVGKQGYLMVWTLRGKSFIKSCHRFPNIPPLPRHRR